ncbi:MAG TPA: hypothetical protein VLM79_35340 [Kofleriaceae bacterium]|nr:hypothetical protein [Kofleriaceae bacterium]
MPDNDDKTVKELIGEATQADLERWFGLPSFQQLAEQQAPKPADDPEWAEFRKRRADAIAAVDPNMLEAHRRRVERQRELKLFQSEIEPRVRTDITMLDHAAIDRRTIAEPRTYELPFDLADALTERTPQALLRDLHRPELIFEKMFEWFDPTVEHRIDLRAIINEALAFRPSSTKKIESKVREARALLAEVRQERRKPWTALTSKMPNRRVTE